MYPFLSPELSEVDMAERVRRYVEETGITLPPGTWLTIGQVARLLGFKRRRVAQWAENGTVAYIQPAPDGWKFIPGAEVNRMTARLAMEKYLKKAPAYVMA
jgi:hypothetical protein